VSEARVLLMRHGESEGNVANVWTSSHVGYPLTDKGHVQAREAGERFREEGVSALYASRIPRAQETAAEIGDVLALPVRTLAGVEEFDVGVHEGVHDDDVAPVAAEVFGRWMRDGDLSAGFEGGESGESVVARMLACLDLVADENPAATSVVVSHGGAIAISAPVICDNLTAEVVVTNLLGNCDVVELERGPDGWRCLRWAGHTL
jgi:2,3-bisphosphoglycerate-dependent phosphoglycerate mutase